MSEPITWKYKYDYNRRFVNRRRRFAFGEPIDDGKHYYHSKKLCFNCQKVWRPWFYTRNRDCVTLPNCPQCGGPLVSVGPMFKTPRRRDRRSWNQLRKILSKAIVRAYERQSLDQS